MDIKIFTTVKVYIDTKYILSQKVIYKLTFPNGKIYIGQTIQRLGKRLSDHCSRAFKIKDGCFDTIKSRAIRKYMTFKVEILYQGENLDDKEIEYISYFNSNNSNFGYNTEFGGNSKKIISQDTKNKLSEVMKKNKRASKNIIVINIASKEERTFDSLKCAGEFYETSPAGISQVLRGNQSTFKNRQYTARYK